jgi:hypothetical protein
MLPESDWLACSGSWRALLAASDCDPLFCSPEWQQAWWRHFGRRSGAELHVMSAWRGADLVGLASFCRVSTWRHGMLPVRSLQPVGASWRDPSAETSEYLDIVCRESDRPEVRQAMLCGLLRDPSWNEIALPNTTRFEDWREDLGATARIACRIVDQWSGHQCELGAGFAAYLRALGASTRRSLFHLRRRLASEGAIRLESVDPSQCDDALTALNDLHARRWQRPAYSATALTFHGEICRLFGAAGQLRVSRLRVGAQVVSVLYDLRIGTRQYNLQMGFDPAHSQGVSLGLLHLGFQMERAADEGVATYDLLAGRGKTADYKPRLASMRTPMATVHAMRGRLRAPLLRAYGVLRG